MRDTGHRYERFAAEGVLRPSNLCFFVEGETLRDLVFMKIHVAYRGDGVYRIAEHKGIYRIARELGIDQGMSDSDIRKIVDATLEEYHSACLADPEEATRRFHAAADRVHARIKNRHGEKRMVCGYLLSIATSDRNIASGELRILNDLERRWGMERTQVPF